MTRLTITQQIDAMKSAWSIFKVKKVNRTALSVKWVGTVKPHLVAYTLDIRLTRGDPEVRILSPKLVRLPDNPEGRLPHIYGPIEDPTLCLYDPAKDEWDPSMAVADTIVPWSLDWIACYEFWLMNGRWEGGGRHPVAQTIDAQGAF